MKIKEHIKNNDELVHTGRCHKNTEEDVSKQKPLLIVLNTKVCMMAE